MLAPVRLENSLGSFPERVALCHRQIFFLIFCENRDKKDRKSLVAPDIYNPRPPTFAHSFAGDSDLSKSPRSTDQGETVSGTLFGATETVSGTVSFRVLVAVRPQPF